jgi:CubicO group peptidase (beta-lactamase class C family)
LKLPARDLAKFGYLYLNGGRWDGRQLIPADYVRASTRPYGDVPGLAGSYGYQWWETSADGHDSFYAAGAGGQVIRVIPDLDLVVVITSDPDQALDSGPRLVERVVLPSITE